MVRGADTHRLLLMTRTEPGYRHPFTFTGLLKKGGLQIPGALSPTAVKELTLMINLPHTLPLPDLSKQGRAEERKAEGGEKAGEESLGYSN